jgi:hypothetical protein
MSFLKNIFGYSKKSQDSANNLLNAAGKVIITGYRQVASQNNSAPTAKTSDAKIIEIYQKVGSAFRTAAKQRGEQLPAENLNFIVWKFFKVYELMGDKMLDDHLKYEIDKYLNEGLRSDYRQS